MWYFKSLVVLGLTCRSLLAADNSQLSTPAGSALVNTTTETNSTDEDSEDLYIPSPEWSDTFDWQLLKAFSSRDHKNVLISPISLKLVLAILYEGATGSTEKEFQTVLQFGVQKLEVRERFMTILEVLQREREDYILNIGTRLFLDSDIVPQQHYVRKIRSAYQASIDKTNFTNNIEASFSINSWIDTLTNGRIREIVNPDDLKETVLLVANGIYFQGYWAHKFPKDATKERGFYVTPSKIVTVEYMSLTEKLYYVDSDTLDSKIIRLPYKGSKFAMFIILPNSKAGLSELISKISLPLLRKQLHLLDFANVAVTIPKLKFDFSARYRQILQDFGLHQMFHETASFSGIARGPQAARRLVVSDIKQKAGLEVDEGGSTIWAATDVEVVSKFGETEADYVFNATHPFLFFIEEQNSGTILFVGKVENPLQSESVPLPPRINEDTQKDQQPAILSSTAQKPNPGFQLNPISNQGPSISERFNYFDLELLQTFEDHENFFISPASIKATLAMVLEGARGSCAEQISRVLRIPLNQHGAREQLQRLLYDLNEKRSDTIIRYANGAFISNKFKVVPEFERNLRQYYNADIKYVDFANNELASTIINSWASNTTRGLIPEIISPANFNSDATIVIANAMYFKGTWQKQFNPKSTSVKCFQSYRKDCLHVDMMQTVDTFYYKHIDALDSQALQLSYNDGEYAMLVVLPSKKHSISGLIRDLQHTPFNSIIASLEAQEVTVALPKFEIEYHADMIEQLKNLGIDEIFESAANLTGIISKDHITINNMVHKAKVEVNEKGTVAAAATGVVVIPLMDTTTPNFQADRPFLFFIYSVKTGNILFEGKLVEPQEVKATPSGNAQQSYSAGRFGGSDPYLNYQQPQYSPSYQRPSNNYQRPTKF